MPQFTGTNKEFNEFLGGYCRNRANQLAKKYRTACNKTCQYCQKTNAELESAHVNGIERRWIIQKILDDNFKTGESFYSVDLNKFSELYDNFHMPISEHFYFLCKDCHTKYDRKKISDDEIKLAIENNDMQNLIRENVSKNTADKSNQLENKKSFEDDEIMHLFKKFKHEVCKTDLQDINKKIEFEIEAINKILKFNKISGWKDLVSSKIFYKLLNKYENLYKSQHNNSTKIYLDALNDFKWFVNKIKFNNNSNSEKSEIESSRDFKSYSTKNIVEKSYLQSSLQLEYSDYLSQKYSSNTILTYCSSINRVMYNENYESWEKVAQNIDKLLIDYDKYGCKSELGQHGHESVINALRRFKEFLIDTK